MPLYQNDRVYELTKIKKAAKAAAKAQTFI
jgi:hypothetical protein